MNAPERVWVEFRNPFVDFARWNDATGGEPYIRADLYDAQAAEIAGLRRQLAEARDKALEEACEVVESNFPGTLYASNRTKTLTKIRALKGAAK